MSLRLRAKNLANIGFEILQTWFFNFVTCEDFAGSRDSET